MSFPRNNLCITFLDAPISSLGTPFRLYLPLKRSVKYFKFFNNSSSIFIHTSTMPSEISYAVLDMISQSTSAYLVLNDEKIESFFSHANCLSLVKCIEKKRRFNRWMKLIGHVEKWSVPLQRQLKTGGFNLKKQTLCSIFLHFALSKKRVKEVYNL